MAGSNGSRHPEHGFEVVKVDEVAGLVYVAVQGMGVDQAACFPVAELLNVPEVLARLPAAHLERVRSLASRFPGEGNRADAVSVREIVGGWHNAEYRTVYTGTMEALMALGVATQEQFPTGLNGSQYWTKSCPRKDWTRRGDQAKRWKVVRLRKGKGLFEVHRWHEPRPTRPAFERFMVQAMNSSAT